MSRGTVSGNGIVTEGLVFALDAANFKSYPGSGTTWFDLATTGNNGALTNGPIFSSANGGNISFDGVNDYYQLNARDTNLEFQPNNSYSAFVWFKGPPTTVDGALIANMLGVTPFNGWDIWFNRVNTDNTIAAHLISSWSGSAVKVIIDYNYSANQDKWLYFGYTYDGSCPTNQAASLNSINFYWMGSLYTSGKQTQQASGFASPTESISYNASQRFRVANRWRSTGTSAPITSVTVANVQIYNRVLSAAEVLQNYNATKTRFGL